MYPAVVAFAVVLAFLVFVILEGDLLLRRPPQVAAQAFAVMLKTADPLRG
jgi:hypothetical protein